jgi:hypothetical protein
MIFTISYCGLYFTKLSQIFFGVLNCYKTNFTLLLTASV